ncbi:hemagglutinin repeat-containing protein, partial [Klebsiella electrica]
QQTHVVEQKTSGLTLALSGTAGSALNSVVQATQDAKSAGSSRLQALQGVKAALSGIQASQAARLDAAQGNDPANNNTVGISLSYGSQSSTSTQRSTQTTTQGSTLTAGHDLSISAREGDLTAAGSQLKAGNDVALSASRDITLQSAQNTQLLEGKNDSHGGTVGVGIGVGSGGWGISVSASANKGKGSESGTGTTHSETTVDAGNRLTLNSGRDTTLTGAQVSGDTIIAGIGRNLTLTSEQDSDRYDSKQQNASAGGSFTFGSMSGSASVNLSQDRMHSNYDSVVEQTGIFAGKGGYDITVGGHTQLDGAVIGSTATADKNRLDTGTLGWGDIDNRAGFKTEHQSVGFSSGGSIGSQFAGNMANGLLTGGNNEGHDSSTTHAAVSEGAIIVRNKDKQQQDVANLSRDVEHASQTLSPIFDKEKEQQRLQQSQLIGEIGSQVADIARTEGQINAINAGKAELAKEKINEPGKGASKEAWEKYNAQLAATEGYKAAQQQWGTGSSVQQAIQAATAAVQGLAGSDLKAALAGAAAPYVAEIIGHYSNLDNAGKVAAHAVVNAALAAAQNQSALAGAAGAATAEIVGIIATQMYGKPASELDETQKQTVSTLATLAAGLAGGLAGDSSASAVSGAQAGKTTVENNNLALIARGCAALSPCRNKVAEQLLEIGAKAGIVGLAGAAIKDVADKMTSDELDHLITLEMMGNDEITGKYLSSLQDKYAPSHTGNNDGQVNIGPNNTGNNDSQANTGPNDTGNNQVSGQSATNTGNTEGAPNTGGNTTVTPIPDGSNKDDLAYLALKGKEAQEAAGKLGFDRRIPAQKAPFNSHGQPVFYDGKNYITPDIDSHNVTNGWKMFDRKGNRVGTYDNDLNRIKD